MKFLNKRRKLTLLLYLITAAAVIAGFGLGQLSAIPSQKQNPRKAMHCLLNEVLLFEFDEDDRKSTAKCLYVVMQVATLGVDSGSSGIFQLKPEFLND